MIKVIESCLDNLKWVKDSLEILNQFFESLHRQVGDVSGSRLMAFIRDVSKRNLTQSRVDVS